MYHQAQSKILIPSLTIFGRGKKDCKKSGRVIATFKVFRGKENAPD